MCARWVMCLKLSQSPVLHSRSELKWVKLLTMQNSAKNVLLFLGLLILTSLPSHVFAEDPGFSFLQGPIGTPMSGGCAQRFEGTGDEQTRSSLTVEDVKNVRCRQTAKAFCGNVSSSDCSSYFGSAPAGHRPRTAANSSGLDIRDTASATEAFNQITTWKENAKPCCARNLGQWQNCKREALGSRAPSQGSARSSGINGDAQVDQDANRDNAMNFSNVAASCRAFRAICMQHANALKNWLDGGSNRSCGENCSSETVDGVFNECAAMDSSFAEGIASQALQSSQEAGRIVERTSSTPRSGGSEAAPSEKKATTADSGSGSQGGPMGQLLSALGPLAKAAMGGDPAQNAANQMTPQASPPQTCTDGSMLAGCQGIQAAKNFAMPHGDSSMTPIDTASNAKNFNLSSIGDLGRNDTTGLDPGGGRQRVATTVTPPPGGSGANLGGGGHGGPASLGGPNGPGGGSRASNAADILRGTEGASAISTVNAGMRMDASGGGGAGAGGGNQAARGTQEKLNLEDFLPGRRGAPAVARNIASISAPQGEFHGKAANIWTRITERFYIHCRQGLLRDCNP